MYILAKLVESDDWLPRSEFLGAYTVYGVSRTAEKLCDLKLIRIKKNAYKITLRGKLIMSENLKACEKCGRKVTQLEIFRGQMICTRCLCPDLPKQSIDDYSLKRNSYDF
jgi:hypothetical protein